MDKSIIDANIVKKIATLAKLNLTDAEIAHLAPEINQIIDYVSQLENVDTTDIDPLYQVNDLKNITRPDAVAPSLSKTEALSTSSKTHDDFFIANATLTHE
jgi:aspartyl-tRNA(Asn)/glutamyl-tRNA(Gln) amidotransferase subunit C